LIKPSFSIFFLLRIKWKIVVLTINPRKGKSIVSKLKFLIVKTKKEMQIFFIML